MSVEDNIALVKKDLETVNTLIRLLVSKENPNFIVIKKDYLDLYVKSDVVPLNDEDGTFAYYTTLKRILDYTITNSSVPENWIHESAPEYLKEFAN